MAFHSFKELAESARVQGSLGKATLAKEAEERGTEPEAVRGQMAQALSVMREAIARGLSGAAASRSGLTGGDARRVSESERGPIGGAFARAIAASLATAEVNAAMGRIVAAPTGGASGVLPAVIMTLAEKYSSSDEELVDALFAAGGVGGVIAARATLSGASGGCQAEIGSGAAMAAAAAVQLLGGSVEESGHAASLALQGLLGLVCDPVAGLVEVPCVVRNATGTAVALSAAEMALAGVEFPIPFDEVVDAMGQVGRSIPPSLRETALGGLATTPSACRIVEEMDN